MPLREEFVRSGGWLFRWRSYLPLILFALLLGQLSRFSYWGGSHRYDLEWEAVCLGVSMLGLAVRVLTVGHAPQKTSGRNTHAQVADELNTTGMYSVVRHPLYLGNFLIWMGVALFLHDAWIAVLVALAFALYYERIMFAEEEFLRASFGTGYVAWAQRTSAFLPDPRRWSPPSLPFSLRNVLRREYSGLFGVIASFTALEVGGDWVVRNRLLLDPVWAVLFGSSLVLYLALRFLKRHTTLLRVPGR